jgi:hypothetical protein
MLKTQHSKLEQDDMHKIFACVSSAEASCHHTTEKLKTENITQRPFIKNCKLDRIHTDE